MLMSPYAIASRKIKKDRTEYLNSLSDIERDVVDFAWEETVGGLPWITKFNIPNEDAGEQIQYGERHKSTAWNHWQNISKGNYPNIYWKEKELHSLGRRSDGGWMKIKAMELIINP